MSFQKHNAWQDHGNRLNFQPWTANREDEARPNIRATSFWGIGEEAFSTYGFSTVAPPYRNKELMMLYKAHKATKNRNTGRESEMVGWHMKEPSSKGWLTS